ncbi:MAG: YceI family protein [Bacteroidia bacterium]
MRILITLFLLMPSMLMAQKYFTRSGNISFYSSTPVEDIEAHNNSANSVLDVSNGAMQFAVIMKSFTFEKALMQEHFNENYVESDEFPKATFKGKIVDINAIDFDEDGNYNVEVKGTMEIHGESQELSTKGTITIKGGKISAQSSFELKPEEYGIEIPSVVRGNIAEIVRVDVSFNYEPLKR